MMGPCRDCSLSACSFAYSPSPMQRTLLRTAQPMPQAETCYVRPRSLHAGGPPEPTLLSYELQEGKGEVRRNTGAVGVDGETVADVELYW